VKDVPQGDRNKAALDLAAKCIADAAMLGIMIDDLEEAAGGSVVNFILIAIEARENKVLDNMFQRVRPKNANGSKEPQG
jgi:hypothetical protein